MTTNTAKRRKSAKRAAHRAQIADAQANWTDREFGITLQPAQERHRAKLIWELDPNFALMSVPRVMATIEGIAMQLVAQARLEGCSWDEIGWLVEMTGEGARRRYQQAESIARDAEAAMASGTPSGWHGEGVPGGQ